MLHRSESSWGKEGMGWKLGSGISRLFTKGDGGGRRTNVRRLSKGLRDVKESV